MIQYLRFVVSPGFSPRLEKPGLINLRGAVPLDTIFINATTNDYITFRNQLYSYTRSGEQRNKRLYRSPHPSAS